MKLLTLNTHSLIGEDFEARAEAFLSALVKEAPDLIALQEVNQTPEAQTVSEKDRLGFVPCGAALPLRADNYAYRISRELAERGLSYFWTWFPIKRGYGRYDEGLAFLCRLPFSRTETVYLSRNRDYEDWHTRMALAILPEGSKEWFYNVHMSWWNGKDGFSFEWERLTESFAGKDTIWLMGDFNNPAEVRNEGYDRITEEGFYDAYLLAEARSGRGTAFRGIDGWKETSGLEDGLRIDQIRCNRAVPIRRYRTVFDGRDLPAVSDHFGVMVETAEE